MKNPMALLVALVLGLFSMATHCSLMKQEREALLYDSETIKTLVATQDIPKNFKLDETMVKVDDIPRHWRQPGALQRVEDILGQISANPIQQGEQILNTKLVSMEDAGLAYKIPKKKRAIAVAVYDVNAVGGHVKPGNYVDILGSFDFGQGEKTDLRTVTIFQNVYVLAVGDDLGQTVARNPDGDDSMVGGSAGAYMSTGANNGTIVLALSPLECQKIVLAQEVGNLTLTLRSLWEDQRFVDLEKTSIHTAIGIPKKVRYRRRASYRTIRDGSF